MNLHFADAYTLTSDVQESVLYGPEEWPMPPALDERVETPTHRSRRTHQRTGAGERKCPMIPTAHFMAFFGAGAAAFAFLIAFVATNACSLAVVLTAFIAFIAARFAFVATNIAFIAFAARIAFAMTRREVSTIPLKRLKTGEMRS